MKRTAVEWFVSELHQRGVEFIATLCGHGQDPLFEAARRAGIRLVDTRNEQTAGYVAEGFGRLSRRPGVCSVSSGVAVVNGFAGLLNAWYDGAPMLMISGAADLATLGMGCFQDLDQTELARPITRFSRTIDCAPRVLQILDEAWAQAQRGPVHLMFPMDVQRTEVAEDDLVRPNQMPAPAGGAPPAQIEAIGRALLEAERPLIIAPSDVYYNGEAADLIAFAEGFHIPVQTPIWDRGVFDVPSDAFCGVVGAASGGPPLLERADLLLLAGAANDYRTGYLQHSKPVFHLTRGWRQLRERMIDTGGLAFAAWLDEARRLRNQHTAHVASLAAEQRVAGRTHAIDIVRAIEEVLPADAVLLIDGGSIGQWAHQLLAHHRYPGHWLTCGRSGVVGYGIGGAMAARLAYPDRAVVLLSGDGAFTFTVADLECAVRQNLPFTAIVADDQCWGITHAGHLKQFGQGIGTRLGPIAFDLLAGSLGAEGRRIDDAAQIAPALSAAIASGKVTVLHVPISGGNPA